MSFLVYPAVGYRIEGGGEEEGESSSKGSSSKESQQQKNEYYDGVFDLSDNDHKHYKEKFVDKGVHSTLLCKDSDMGPCCVSLIRNDEKGYYRAVIRTPEGTTRKKIPMNDVRVSWWRKLLRKGASEYEVLRALEPTLPLGRLKLVSHPDIATKILTLEEKQTIKGFKFGILYAREGQTKEDEMFANVETSKEFEEFLDFIADRVKLNGWDKFRAGLDVKSGTTGKYGLYIVWNNNEIMYHVSTLLPFNPKDKQQLERKRHIGNDIVVVVWQDGDTVYRPTTISSRQVHVAFVVKAVEVEDQPNETFYRMAVVSKEGVPEFGPEMDNEAIFKKGPEFKEFFYSKLLNAERASYDAPILGNKLERTRTALLKDLAESFL